LEFICDLVLEIWDFFPALPDWGGKLMTKVKVAMDWLAACAG
jgi:hypothetical protein